MNAFSKVVASVALTIMAGSASAYTIGGVDIGAADTLLAQTNDLDVEGCGSGGSPATELCWINTVLEPDTTYDVKTENQSYDIVDGEGNESLIGYMLTSPTEYFLVKNSTWWALFENVANFDWAVIDTALLETGFNLPREELSISHVATIGSPVSVQVPEPGTLGLLGLGLFAMGIKRRLAKK